ncbi:hypothetical protein MSG28_007641, partial [Choristoneura fumiferana]
RSFLSPLFWPQLWPGLRRATGTSTSTRPRRRASSGTTRPPPRRQTTTTTTRTPSTSSRTRWRTLTPATASRSTRRATATASPATTACTRPTVPSGLCTTQPIRMDSTQKLSVKVTLSTLPPLTSLNTIEDFIS